MNSLCPWPAPSPRTQVLSQPPQIVSEKELQLRGLVFSQSESCVTDVYRGGGDLPYSSTPQASQTYFVDGICTPWNRQQQMISKFLQGGDPDGARLAVPEGPRQLENALLAGRQQLLVGEFRRGR